MTELVGKYIDRYRILSIIGTGGMATIYKAMDDRLEREVALKLINRVAFSDETLKSLVRRFEREAKSLAKLSHPNIVAIHDYGEFQGAPYLVMELLEGGTLKDYTGIPLPYREAARLLAPVAHALDYAHRLGIVHRDIKPTNILLSLDGTVLLSDFGIAKMASKEGEATELTSAGMSVGTPDYMSPEQWLGNVVPQSDIYSLGVVLYELVTGRKPYEGKTPAAVLLKHASDPLPDPRVYVPDLPDPVLQVLFKALAKKIENRFQNMDVFAAELERLSQQNMAVVDTFIGETVLDGKGLTEENLRTMTRAEPVDYSTVRGQIAPTYDQVAQPQINYPTQTAPAAAPYPVYPPQTRKSSSGKRILIGVLVGALAFACVLVIGVGGYFLLGDQLGLNVPALSALFGSTPTPNQFTTTPTLEATQTVTGNDVVTPTIPPAVEPTDTPVNNQQNVTVTPSITPTEQNQGAQVVTKVASVDGMVMVYVPAGDFLMGQDGDTVVNDGRYQPQHEVFLDAYWMDQTEVTNQQFDLFVRSTGYLTFAEDFGESYVFNLSTGKWESVKGADWRHPRGPGSSISGLGNHPVIHVNFSDAVAYCSWAGRRLPTEAEWEKAARGADGRVYPWGNSEPDGTYMNYADASLGAQGDPNINDGYRYTSPVGNYPAGASPYGVLDMAGNVWEWVADWYDVGYYSNAPSNNPRGPSSGEHRVLRGGAWNLTDIYGRTFHRFGRDPIIPFDRYGFRCAITE